MSQTTSFQKGLELLDYADFFYKGYKINTPFVTKGPDSIKNALKLFLFSKKGDYGRDLSKGGPLIEFLGRPIDAETEESLKKAIFEAIDGYSNIVVKYVNVYGDRENHKWVIHIIFSDTYNKFTDTINAEIG